MIGSTSGAGAGADSGTEVGAHSAGATTASSGATGAAGTAGTGAAATELMVVVAAVTGAATAIGGGRGFNDGSEGITNGKGAVSKVGEVAENKRKTMSRMGYAKKYKLCTNPLVASGPPSILREPLEVN